ncbi:hypothetical protein P5706_15575 [Pseudomonas sp. ChxA]|uniref:hypothetical protein n=1 Tax=Pseudomonas sp. ChxA TaxID=3035473 RepID=UPI0025527E86|nr:hypothetical protein [Pseudomonas sp. ChxA]MDL2185604.1 hypothetical protein [Pseudomonas sp. ChxA]
MTKHDNLTINYKFNQAELDARVFHAEVEYEAHIQGSQRYDYEAGKEVVVTDAAKVRVFENSLAEALYAFAANHAAGYTLINTVHDFPIAITGHGTQPTVAMTMRKPQEVIDARLAEIAKEIEAAYRAELEAKHAVFIEALAEREVAREEQKEREALEAIQAEKAVVRGQRVAALKAELAKSHTIEDAPKTTKAKAK